MQINHQNGQEIWTMSVEESRLLRNILHFDLSGDLDPPESNAFSAIMDNIPDANSTNADAIAVLNQNGATICPTCGELKKPNYHC